jgi:2'-5' RNA ligase
VFPGIKRPRVIWTGVSGQVNQLFGLQKRLEDNLDGLGFPKENRPFKVHLTFGRVKNRLDPKRLGDALSEFSGFESAEFVADRVILYKSDLKPAGAVYTKLVEAVL